eukprot:1181938-Prorocentrum_minimum.AAC.3
MKAEFPHLAGQPRRPAHSARASSAVASYDPANGGPYMSPYAVVGANALSSQVVMPPGRPARDGWVSK